MKGHKSVLSAKSAVKLIQRILTADYADNADVLRNEMKSIYRIFHPIRLIREISGQTNPKNF